jgi:hypothetical protein
MTTVAMHTGIHRRIRRDLALGFELGRDVKNPLSSFRTHLSSFYATLRYGRGTARCGRRGLAHRGEAWRRRHRTR